MFFCAFCGDFEAKGGEEEEKEEGAAQQFVNWRLKSVRPRSFSFNLTAEPRCGSSNDN